MTESEYLDLQMVQERQNALHALYTAHLTRETSPGSSTGNSNGTNSKGVGQERREPTQS